MSRVVNMRKGLQTARHRLAPLVGEALTQVDAEAALADIIELAALDRYQASVGINRAALHVADRARSVGLHDVSLTTFEADGQAHWWDFAAPVAWTPTVARLQTASCGFELDHAVSPFLLATHSASTARGGRTLRLVTESTLRTDDALHDALVLVPSRDWRRTAPVELESLGAAGFATDGNSRQGATGRIELAPESSLFGFSVSPQTMSTLLSLHDVGGSVHVDVQVDRRSRMPIVTAMLPAKVSGAPEVWLIAHLCHPRPSANDNASGVAALIGTADILARQRREMRELALRFVWAPEFCGTAAALHGTVSPGVAFAVNLDMVGQDQATRDSPLCVEVNPAGTSEPLAALADAALAEVFEQTSDAPGRWTRRAPTGTSDHALFATLCPAIALCHGSDPHNHSSADTAEKLSLVELRRAMAATVAISRALAEPAIGAIPRARDARPVSPDELRVPNVRGALAALAGNVRCEVERLAFDEQRYALLFNLLVRSLLGQNSELAATEASRELELKQGDPAVATLVESLRSVGHFGDAR
ncbi:MAG: DUF4910 domain-containing protein [Solirubrobacteraceae bacterium MAG38_C4-C5]|nr:DUF4910 domain-containing protein [Candidatus Siliceabacter maunaloa]